MAPTIARLPYVTITVVSQMTVQTCSPPEKLKQALLKRSDELAMLPAVATEALELAQDPDCVASEFAGVIERDVKLATEILSLSNSVYFAASSPVVSLRQAVVRLGLRQCRNLILTSSAASLMKSMPLEQEWVREVIWQHSFRTAKVAGYINKQLRMGFEGEEFTAGLLHDFGRLLLAVAAPESFAKADPLAFVEDGQCLTAENEILGIDHCAFGAWFATHNGLPRALVASIELHHLPETHHPDGRLISLVAAADHIANHFQRYEAATDYDVGLNRGAHVIAKNGHPQLLKNDNGIVDTIFGEVLQDDQRDPSDLS